LGEGIYYSIGGDGGVIKREFREEPLGTPLTLNRDYLAEGVPMGGKGQKIQGPIIPEF